MPFNQKEYKQKWNLRNKERIQQLCKNWYERNKEHVRITGKAYREANKEQLKDRARRYAALPKYREYHKEYGKKKYQAKREYIQAHKRQHPCIDCGETDPICLTLDHCDPRTKKFGIASGARNTMEDIIAEIAKCVVRCANCHMKQTWKQRQAKIVTNKKRDPI